jgi:hypothetical protein
VSTDPQPLHVEVLLPPAPYALATAGFLATLAQVEAEIAAMAVTDAASAQVAANVQSRLTSAGTTLEKQRKALKQPFIDAGKAIDQAADAPAKRIEAAKSEVKRLLTNYDAEQRRLAAEAEARRVAEIKRLEDIARLEREAEQKKADELAKAAAAATQAAGPVAEEWGEEPAPVVVAPKSETEKKIEALHYAPPVVVVRPAGVTMRVTLTATVVDASKLPDVFVDRVPKLAAIRATFCNSWKEGQAMPVLEGVRFEVSRVPVSTGR